MTLLEENTSQMTTAFTPPEDIILKARAYRFVKDNKPSLYRQLKKSGELRDYLDQKVAACKRYATNLIAAGEFPPQAWYRAECLCICERETD